MAIHIKADRTGVLAGFLAQLVRPLTEAVVQHALEELLVVAGSVLSVSHALDQAVEVCQWQVFKLCHHKIAHLAEGIGFRDHGDSLSQWVPVAGTGDGVPTWRRRVRISGGVRVLADRTAR